MTLQVGTLGDIPDRAREEIERFGAHHVGASLSAIESAGPDLVVCTGVGAIRSLARSDLTVPALVVASPGGFGTVDVDQLPEALNAIAFGDAPILDHRLLAIDEDGERSVAVRDACLMSNEPARISEYSITSSASTIDRFRADGVVFATAAGSHGYARAAGGPLVAPDTGLSVVPIAPFKKDPDHWILQTSGGTCHVHRDETDVAVVVDGEHQRTVSGGAALAIRTAERFGVYHVGSA